jgi:hypothetical protein
MVLLKAVARRGRDAGPMSRKRGETWGTPRDMGHPGKKSLALLDCVEALVDEHAQQNQ